MGRHKKISIESSLHSPPLMGEEFVPNALTSGLKYKKLVASLEDFIKTYSFEVLALGEIEEREGYDRLAGFGRQSFCGGLVPVAVNGREYVLRPDLKTQILRQYINSFYKDIEKISRLVSFGYCYTKNDFDNINKELGFNTTLLGQINHLSLAQLVNSLWRFFSSLDIANISLEVNCIGELGARRNFPESLLNFLGNKKYDLCDRCGSLSKDDVFLVYSCVNASCRSIASEGPIILDYIEGSMAERFTLFLESLDELRLPYQLNHMYFGDRDQCNIIFRIRFEKEGEVFDLACGGEMDEVISILGGVDFKGFSSSMNAFGILNAIPDVEEGAVFRKYDVFLVPLGDSASKMALRLFHEMIGNDIRVYNHFGLEGIKNQLRAAQGYKAPLALIMGQKEAQDGVVILRDVKSGMQEMFRFEHIINEVMKRLGR